MRHRVKCVRALQDLISGLAPTAVVDVGANPTEKPPYQALLRAEQARVVGFEPDPRAFARLEAAPQDNITYLNAAVGDGGRHKLHVCRGSFMSSLLRPDPRAAKLFPQMARSMEVVDRMDIDTVALDELDAIARIDLLKIDVQGSELTVFQNARRKLATAICVQTEVSFFPIYENQPGFGDVDAELRAQGFLPHALPVLHTNPVAPFKARRRHGSQLCDGDIIYLRDLRTMAQMDDAQLQQLAVIAAGYLGAMDICARALLALSGRGLIPAQTVRDFLDAFPAPHGRFVFAPERDARP